MATNVTKTNTKWAKSTFTNPPIEEAQLTYPGKLSKTDILRLPPAILHSLWGKETAAHRLYYGDNLPFLIYCLSDPQVYGQVRLIYIDPPYATNGVFQSRTQRDAYHDLLTGSDYIEFMRQRLIILRELLAEDGSIYLHLDENMVFHMKVIMDEVFGAKNFRNLITRRKSSHKNYTRKTYGNISDYILFYSKNDIYIWHRPIEQWTEERAKKEYTNVEPGTGRRYKKVPIHAPGVRNGATGSTWRGMLPPQGKHWQYTPQQLDEMDARGEIYWSPTGNPRRKIYLDRSEGIPLQDIWYEFRDAQNQNMKITGYPTEKNIEMMQVIIQASSNPGDLILDCFAGSGTTLSEAAHLGRRWIGIDNSPEALRTMLYRFAHGTTPMGDFVPEQAKSQGQQLRLLESSLVNYFTPLTDFVLYGVQPADEETTTLLNEWKEWIQGR